MTEAARVAPFGAVVARSGNLTGNRLSEGGRRSNIPLLSCFVRTTRQRQQRPLLPHNLQFSEVHLGFLSKCELDPQRQRVLCSAAFLDRIVGGICESVAFGLTFGRRIRLPAERV